MALDHVDLSPLPKLCHRKKDRSIEGQRDTRPCWNSPRLIPSLWGARKRRERSYPHKHDLLLSESPTSQTDFPKAVGQENCGSHIDISTVILDQPYLSYQIAKGASLSTGGKRGRENISGCFHIIC
jgi:hypothetical protein